MSELWKTQFDAEMVKLGYSYFAEARSSVLRHVNAKGTPQALIVQSMGLSKQAVQQLIDDLVDEGVVTRVADPNDKRGRLIVLTQKGLAALHDAKKIKRKIESQYEKLIGTERLDELAVILDELAARLREQ
jgi:DNA-binding MarR family transcriptional regulator